MLRQLIGATAIVVVFAETRFRPADYPTTDIYWSSGYGSNLSSENRWRQAEEEQKYREAVKRIPDRKASSDPQKTVRQAPAAAPVDRHGTVR